MHEAELISIYYGEDFSAEEAEALAADLEEAYPDCDIEVNLRRTADLLLSDLRRVKE